jgi:hypothetical protein
MAYARSVFAPASHEVDGLCPTLNVSCSLALAASEDNLSLEVASGCNVLALPYGLRGGQPKYLHPWRAGSPVSRLATGLPASTWKHGLQLGCA